MIKFRGSALLRGAATLILILAIGVLAVDRNNFKTCEQSSFCRSVFSFVYNAATCFNKTISPPFLSLNLSLTPSRCRKVEPGNSVFEVVPGTVQTFRDHVNVDLINRENQHQFVLKLESVQGNTFHLEIDEKTPLQPRYRVVDALKGPVSTAPVQVTKAADETTIVSENKKAVIVHKPLRIDFYLDDVLTVSVNSKGLMRFEHLRKKPEGTANDGTDTENGDNTVVKSIEDADPGAWEENFKSHHDSKKKGPEAIALDFSFPRADILFGIPEHADSFALKSTIDGEPYRLYNLDVFEYELNNGMALYGEN